MQRKAVRAAAGRGSAPRRKARAPRGRPKNQTRTWHVPSASKAPRHVAQVEGGSGWLRPGKVEADVGRGCEVTQRHGELHALAAPRSLASEAPAQLDQHLFGVAQFADVAE